MDTIRKAHPGIKSTLQHLVETHNIGTGLRNLGSLLGFSLLIDFLSEEGI